MSSDNILDRIISYSSIGIVTITVLEILFGWINIKNKS